MRKQLFKRLSLASLLLVPTLVACDDTNNYGEVDRPKLVYEGDDSISLQTNTTANRSSALGGKFVIKNSGKLPFEITDIEFFNTPKRFVLVQQNAVSTCSSGEDAACGGTKICLAQQCFVAEPKVPIKIVPNQNASFRFALKAGTADVKCEGVHSEVPEDFRANYCGEVRFKTSIQKAEGSNEKDSVVLYLQKGSTSGTLSVSPSTLQFKDILPGESQEKEVTITNTGVTDLTLFSVIFSGAQPDQLKKLSIDPPFSTQQIAPQGTFKFKVKLTTEATDENLKYEARLAINSSASESIINVQVESESSNYPIPQVDPPAIAFTNNKDEAQTFEIKNIGSGILNIKEFNLLGGNSDKYEFTIKDKLLTSLKNINYAIGKDQTVTVSVKLKDELGRNNIHNVLRIDTNKQTDGPLDVVLFGDLGGVASPYLRVFPTATRLQGKANETRTLIIKNIGNAPVEITTLEIDPGDSEGSGAFSIGGINGKTISPNEILTATVKEVVDVTKEISTTYKYTGPTSLLDVPSFRKDPYYIFSLHSISTKPQTAPLKTITPSRIGTAALKPKKMVRLKVDVANHEPTDQCGWYLAAKPANSKADLVSLKPQNCTSLVKFIPDVAGDYKLLSTVESANQGAEAELTLTVVD